MINSITTSSDRLDRRSLSPAYLALLIGHLIHYGASRACPSWRGREHVVFFNAFFFFHVWQTSFDLIDDSAEMPFECASQCVNILLILEESVA